MASRSLLQERQLRLPSLFLSAVGFAAFMMISAWIAWQLYTNPYDDLPTFYWATHLAFDQGLSAYDPFYFQELGQTLGRKIYPFLYPPPSLLLFSPALLCADYEQCKAVFSGLNLVWWWSLVWMLYVLYGRCVGWVTTPLWASALMALATLVYMPLTDTLKNGQVNLVVLLCLMPVLLAPGGRVQQVLCGLLLACAIVLKVYVLLLLPVLLVFGRWREAIAALVCLVVLVGMSVVLLPAHMWYEWWMLGSNAGYGRGIPHLLTIPFNQSVNGFFIRHFLDQRGAGQPADWIFFIYSVVLVCVSAAVYAISKYLRHWQQGCSAALALVLLLINLVAPLTWLHHYVFALPAVVWVWALLQQMPRTGRKYFVVAVFALALVLLAAPFVVAGWFAGILPPAGQGRGMDLVHNLALSIPLAAATVIFAIFIYLASRRG
jgi:alpha-1,2-mannosyltransferase